MGKSQATAAAIAQSVGAECICDPHKDSLAKTALIHAKGNVLFCRLSDIRHSIGFDLLTRSEHTDDDLRELENQLQAENFVDMLKIALGKDSLGPLQIEWLNNVLELFLNNARRFAPSVMQYAFMPGTREFEQLMSGARNIDRSRFLPLQKLSLRALRSEVGSTARPINSLFGSPIFAAWSRGGFNLGQFYQDCGILIIERGDECGDVTMKMLIGCITYQTIKVGVRRKNPFPHIRIRVDEAVNAGLAFPHLIKATAETAKNGVYIEFLVQNLNFPNNKADEVIQNCARREYFRCPLRELARQAATDVLSCLGVGDEESRAKELEKLTSEIQKLKPGWRWVIEDGEAHKEYVNMLENPWPDWTLPDGRKFREARMEEKLCLIYQKSPYKTPATPTSGGKHNAESSPSSTPADATPPPTKSESSSSAAERWERRKHRSS